MATYSPGVREGEIEMARVTCYGMHTSRRKTLFCTRMPLHNIDYCVEKSANI